MEVPEGLNFFVQAPEGVRVFYYLAASTSFPADGEVYTNIDRMPSESGSIAEVTRALCRLKMEEQAMIRRIRAETVRQPRKPKAEPEVVEPVQPDSAADAGA